MFSGLRFLVYAFRVVVGFLVFRFDADDLINLDTVETLFFEQGLGEVIQGLTIFAY